MTPYIPHARHEPFPIALVNRKPWGALNHSSVYTPQNEAWLSAIRNAESTVFIQSPDINAEPLIPALLDAVRRGVEVTMYACLGYNDLGELLPFQGGTNEMISHEMYTELDPEQRERLHIHWYVGKDQTKPLHNKFKQRSCHSKASPCADLAVTIADKPRSKANDSRRAYRHPGERQPGHSVMVPFPGGEHTARLSRDLCGLGSRSSEKPEHSPLRRRVAGRRRMERRRRKRSKGRYWNKSGPHVLGKGGYGGSEAREGGWWLLSVYSHLHV